MRRFLVALAFSFVASSSAFAEGDKIGVSQLQAAPVGSIYSITGLATNLTEKVIKTVFLKFNLYDQQGNLVGNTLAVASGLEPHGTWKFKADTPTQFVTFKVSEISTFDN